MIWLKHILADGSKRESRKGRDTGKELRKTIKKANRVFNQDRLEQNSFLFFFLQCWNLSGLFSPCPFFQPLQSVFLLLLLSDSVKFNLHHFLHQAERNIWLCLWPLQLPLLLSFPLSLSLTTVTLMHDLQAAARGTPYHILHNKTGISLSKTVKWLFNVSLMLTISKAIQHSQRQVKSLKECYLDVEKQWRKNARRGRAEWICGASH